MSMEKGKGQAPDLSPQHSKFGEERKSQSSRKEVVSKAGGNREMWRPGSQGELRRRLRGTIKGLGSGLRLVEILVPPP